jgi:S1-C subfamily serine protease
MFSYRSLPTPFFLLAATLAAGTVRAVDAATVDAAKKVFEQHQNSVVAINAVVKLQISAGGAGNQTQEQSLDLFGTVVNDKGLTVVNYSSLDISSQVMAQVKGRLPAGMKLDVKADFKEVKIITSDGDEIPGDVVLKDPTLDLAFIKPDPNSDEAKSAKFTPISLSGPFGEPALLDDVVIIERMGKDLNRLATLNLARVVGIQRKPRTFYLVNDQNTATPVFDLKGNLIGIFARRIFENAAASTIVLPAKDVADIAKQAEEAKAPEKPKEEPKAEEKKDKPDDAKKAEGGAEKKEPAAEAKSGEGDKK